MKDLVSIIVTTLNEEDYIGDCLKSLRGQNYKKKEIIVVDSESEDKTLSIARKYADKIVTRNCIIPKGRNLEAKKAKGNILIFVDADVILPKNWVDKILPYLHDKDTVAAYGDLLPREKDIKSKIVYYLLDFCNFFARSIKMPIFSKLGTAVAIKRDVFEKVGGYPEDRASCEDIALSLKLKKYGKIKFVRKVKGYVSTRRFKRTGYLKLSLIWLFTGSYYLLTKKAILSKYSKDFP